MEGVGVIVVCVIVHRHPHCHLSSYVSSSVIVRIVVCHCPHCPLRVCCCPRRPLYRPHPCHLAMVVQMPEGQWDACRGGTRPGRQMEKSGGGRTYQ
jgi:hypothetical protein